MNNIIIRTRLKIQIISLKKDVDKFKESPDFPTSLYVEFLSLQRKLETFMKEVYISQKLENVSVRTQNPKALV